MTLVWTSVGNHTAFVCR